MSGITNDMLADLRDMLKDVQLVHKDGSVRTIDGKIVTPAPEKKEKSQ